MLNERADSLLLEAKYHAREEQVQRILERLIIEATESNEATPLMAQAFVTPPAFFPAVLRTLGLTQEEFFARIKAEVTNTISLGKTFSILVPLQHACQARSSSLREVPIDVIDETLPKSYQILYSGRTTELEEITTESSTQAIARVLKILEGDIPFVRYRKDLAERSLELKPGFVGTMLASLPTNIPNVDLRYVYPNNQQFPILSLVVKPF